MTLAERAGDPSVESYAPAVHTPISHHIALSAGDIPADPAGQQKEPTDKLDTPIAVETASPQGNSARSFSRSSSTDTAPNFLTKVRSAIQLSLSPRTKDENHLSDTLRNLYNMQIEVKRVRWWRTARAIIFGMLLVAAIGYALYKFVIDEQAVKARGAC